MERYNRVNLHDLLSKSSERAEISKVQSAKIENYLFCVVVQKNFLLVICSQDIELKLEQRKISNKLL